MWQFMHPSEKEIETEVTACGRYAKAAKYWDGDFYQCVWVPHG